MLDILLFFSQILPLLRKKLEYILLLLRDVSKEVLRVTVIHLILMESCYLDLVRILSILLLSLLTIFLLLELNTNRLGMSERLGVTIVVIFLLLLPSLIGSKMKTIFVISGASLVGTVGFSLGIWIAILKTILKVELITVQVICCVSTVKILSLQILGFLRRKANATLT